MGSTVGNAGPDEDPVLVPVTGSVVILYGGCSVSMKLPISVVPCFVPVPVFDGRPMAPDEFVL